MSDDQDDPRSVAAFGQKYGSMDTVALIKAFRAVKEHKEEADTAAKAITAEHDYLAKVAIPQRFADEGLKNLSVTGVGRVSLTADLYTSVKAGMKDKFYQWLGDIGSGDLIQQQVPPSSLKAFIKGLIKGGSEYPEEMVNVTPYQRATLTKE